MSSVASPLTVASEKAAAAPCFHLGYRPWLDGLRGIAISCVIIFHVGHVIFRDAPMLGSYFGLSQGYLGVDIFFVLSGFLITTLLLEEWDEYASIRLCHFYLRRALRLLPALSVFLAVTMLVAYSTMPQNDAYEVYASAGYSWFYCVNWISALELAPVADSLSHTWSLSIEEQFYWLWPVILLGMLRLRISRGAVVSILIAAIILITAHRVLLVWSGAPVSRFYGATDTRADSLLIGCLVGMVLTWRLLPQHRRVRFVLGLAAFVSVLMIELYLSGHMPGSVFTFGFTFFGLAVGNVITYVMYSPPRLILEILQAQFLVWLGKLSYSLYLWHLFAVAVAVRVLGLNSPHLTALTAIAIAIGVSAVSCYFVERPILKLKSRFSRETSIGGYSTRIV